MSEHEKTLANLSNRFSNYRDHHEEKGKRYAATYNCLTEKQRQETLQLQQQLSTKEKKSNKIGPKLGSRSLKKTSVEQQPPKKVKKEEDDQLVKLSQTHHHQHHQHQQQPTLHHQHPQPPPPLHQHQQPPPQHQQLPPHHHHQQQPSLHHQHQQQPPLHHQHPQQPPPPPLHQHPQQPPHHQHQHQQQPSLHQHRHQPGQLNSQLSHSHQFQPYQQNSFSPQTQFYQNQPNHNIYYVQSQPQSQLPPQPQHLNHGNYNPQEFKELKEEDLSFLGSSHNQAEHPLSGFSQSYDHDQEIFLDPKFIENFFDNI